MSRESREEVCRMQRIEEEGAMWLRWLSLRAFNLKMGASRRQKFKYE